MMLIPIAFVNDHIETLFELDLEYAGELAEEVRWSCILVWTWWETKELILMNGYLTGYSWVFWVFLCRLDGRLKSYSKEWEPKMVTDYP